jgi:RNA-directed DNA polymerase
LKRISHDIRDWALHHRSDKSLTELAQMYNPCIRGWIIYYSHFYKTQLRPTRNGSMPMSSGGHVASSNACATRPKGREIGLTGSAVPMLFTHWPLCHGNGRTSGAV